MLLLINSLSLSLQDIVGMDYIQSNPLLNNGKFTLLVNGILGSVLGAAMSLIKQIIKVHKREDVIPGHSKMSA
jgi:hypothetical protein